MTRQANRRGSVLVVVLGILAILAVVGVAMVTMSGVDRQTVQSFSLQTQFGLMADGAVDYVSHALVDDLWEWDVSNKKYRRLLSVTDSTETFDIADKNFDWFLTSPVTDNQEPQHRAFSRSLAARYYGIEGFEEAGDEHYLNTLDFPVAESSQRPLAVWNPDLSCPFEGGLVRVAVAVLDHGSMVNVNAHGYGSAPSWPYADAADQGAGYFICEVEPVNILDRSGLTTGSFGRWQSTGFGGGAPGIPETGETLIELPHIVTTGRRNLPFTLAEEFELRRLRGTFYTSRLEQIWTGLKVSPDSVNITSARNRLGLTTVSWTSEVRGDKNSFTHLTGNDGKGDGGEWSARKVDLNLDSGDAIYSALKDHQVITNDNDLKQLVANILAYRDGDNTFEDEYAGFVGAERQPFFSEMGASYVQEADVSEEGEVEVEKEIWTIKFELFNPWPGDNPWENTLSLNKIEVFVRGSNLTSAGANPPLDIGALKMPKESARFTDGRPAVYEYSVEVDRTKGELITTKFQTVMLRLKIAGFPGAIDMITPGQVKSLTDMAKQAGAGSHVRGARKFGIVTETRGPGGDEMPVIYIDGWTYEQGEGGFGDPPQKLTSVAGLVPIRVANSVPDDYDPMIDGTLPIRATAGRQSYKAFARLGELNRVLAPKNLPGNWFWFPPWVIALTESNQTDRNIKFDWRAYPEAANYLCVGGPWSDNVDNDGDGFIDGQDDGTSNSGRRSGPELRVAGKININTATEDTLRSMLSGVNLSVSPAAIISRRPFDTIGKLAQVPGNAGNEAKGDVEKDDIVFTRLSNITTTRSDVFSVYGTIQFIDLANSSGSDVRVLRGRRFWALIDRSPALAYAPTEDKGLHPRVMNFQWLD